MSFKHALLLLDYDYEQDSWFVKKDLDAAGLRKAQRSDERARSDLNKGTDEMTI